MYSRSIIIIECRGVRSDREPILDSDHDDYIGTYINWHVGIRCPPSYVQYLLIKALPTYSIKLK